VPILNVNYKILLVTSYPISRKKKEKKRKTKEVFKLFDKFGLVGIEGVGAQL